MLTYDLSHWGMFLSAAVLLNISPGPDLAFILAQTVARGRIAGCAAMIGIWTGAFCHVIFAVVGLSAVLAASAMLFSIVKWTGVVYLAWLGLKAFRSKGSLLSVPAGDRLLRPARVFVQGILVDLLNPKVAIFFIAFLPQFVVAGAGPVWLQMLFHGVLIIGVAALVEPLVVLLGHGASARLRSSARFSRWMDRALGTLLLGLAARLAASRR